MHSVEERYRGRQVRVFRLNRDAILTALEAAARHLVAVRPEVREIRLFGSMVTGRAGPGSDADILIVLTESRVPFLDRIPEYARLLEGAGIGSDIFPYTEAELARLHREGSHFVNTAWRQSRLLAARVADAV